MQYMTKPPRRPPKLERKTYSPGPPVKDLDQRRKRPGETSLNVRMSDAEYAVIKAAAEAAGMGVSGYVRWALGNVRTDERRTSANTVPGAEKHDGAGGLVMGDGRPDVRYDRQPVRAVPKPGGKKR